MSDHAIVLRVELKLINHRKFGYRLRSSSNVLVEIRKLSIKTDSHLNKSLALPYLGVQLEVT